MVVSRLKQTYLGVESEAHPGSLSRDQSLALLFLLCSLFVARSSSSPQPHQICVERNVCAHMFVCVCIYIHGYEYMQFAI